MTTQNILYWFPLFDDAKDAFEKAAGDPNVLVVNRPRLCLDTLTARVYYRGGSYNDATNLRGYEFAKIHFAKGTEPATERFLRGMERP